MTDHRFLGGTGRWRDSGMVLAGHGVRAATPARLHPRALAARDALADQVDALTAVLEEVAPQVVVTYAADGGYGHPDHVRAHELTAAAVRRVPEVARLFATVIGRATARTPGSPRCTAPTGCRSACRTPTSCPASRMRTSTSRSTSRGSAGPARCAGGARDAGGAVDGAGRAAGSRRSR